MKNLLLIGVLAAGSALAAPVYTVIPTLGPDFVGSPNFAAWATNVVQVMMGNANTGSGVTAYAPLANGTTLNGNEFISTPGFASWQGVTPGPYSTENGTALYFSLRVTDVAGFTIGQLGAQEIYLGQTQLPYVPGDFGGATPFNAYRVGTLLVGGGTTNGSTPGSSLLSALYYVGLGFVQGLDPAATGSNQNKINVTVAGVQALANRTTQVCYSLAPALTGPGVAAGLPSNCGYVNVQGAIPEPGTWALMGAGLAGLAFLRRRK